MTTETTLGDVLLRGVRVRYLEAGEGTPLLLLHGFIVDHRCFDLLVPELAKHYRVIAPDLPGFGDSERPRDYAYTRESFAETVGLLLGALGVSKAHVLGHSMGGSVSLVLAAEQPERVQSLTLINSICYPFPVPFTGRIPLIPVLGPLVFKQLYNRALFHDYFKRSVFSPGFAYNRAAVDGFYDSFKSADSREAAYTTLLNTLDLTSLEPKIARVRARSLVLWGEKDPMFPVALGQRLAKDLRDSQLVTIPGCGHSPPEERPTETLSHVLRHLRGERS